MTTENARPFPSLAPARRILAVGLLTGVLALLATPAAATAGSTERVSVDSAGNQQIGSFPCCPSSRQLTSISADGRFVAFVSDGQNLVPGEPFGGEKVYVHDRVTGVTERVSVDSAGNRGDRPSSRPAISADGRFVAFYSLATNLVPGDTNGVGDVFVHDRQTGVTERVSVDSAGNQANDGSEGLAISADGRFVAFDSFATNLVPGDTNGQKDVFVHDRVTGTTERVSVDSFGNQGNGGSNPSISADGRFVAFGSGNVFVHDRATGTTELVSMDSAGNSGNSLSDFVSISADGRFVAFESFATNLSPGDTNGWADVFVHDRATRTTERVSVGSAGNQGDNRSLYPSISADGRFVAFESFATNLVPADSNAALDVFVHDRVTRTTERVSVDSFGSQGNGASSNPSISGDGRFVAFFSGARNLVPGDTNNFPDVFVRDRSEAEDTTPPFRNNGWPTGTLPAGTTEVALSLTTHEDATCRYSATPEVTYEAMPATFATTGSTAHTTPVDGLSDGESYVFYVRCRDTAGNTNPDDYSIGFSVAMRGASPGPTERVSVDSAGNQGSGLLPLSETPSISADGRFVAFVSMASNLVPGDTNGTWDVFVHDRVTGTTELVSVDSAGNQGNSGTSTDSRLAISADGRFVAFASYATNLVPGDTNQTLDVFVHDRETRTTERVSVDSVGNEGNGSSTNPSISADGRFVAFESSATNLVPGDMNGRVDVFVHDRLTGTTELVSLGIAGPPEMSPSRNPSISADGRFVAFQSVATNLVVGDTNGMGGVFVHDRVTRTTERVSVDSAGNEANGFSANPSISADGRFVAFDSLATNLVPGDSSSTYFDVFVHDRVTRTTERVSVDSAGNQGNDRSFRSSISADGRFVAFESIATNLVPGDTNGVSDVFVHDRQTRTTERVSVDSFVNQGNGGSFNASISADGRFVAFDSLATNLVSRDTNGLSDAFVHDRRSPDAP